MKWLINHNIMPILTLILFVSISCDNSESSSEIRTTPDGTKFSSARLKSCSG